MSGLLTHSPAAIIRQFLIDLGQGTHPDDSGDWPIFIASEPDDPDSCITIYDTTAQHNGRVMRGEVQEHDGVQVRVRTMRHEPCYEKTKAIANALEQATYYNGVTVQDTVGTGDSTYTIRNVSRKSGPFSLGRETPTSNRRLFTLNLLAALREL